MTKEEIASRIYVGLFSERDTLEEAYAYVEEVAKASDNPIAVWTAVQVLANTISKQLLKEDA